MIAVTLHNGVKAVSGFEGFSILCRIFGIQRRVFLFECLFLFISVNYIFIVGQ